MNNLESALADIRAKYENSLTEFETFLRENYLCSSISEFINELEKLPDDDKKEESIIEIENEIVLQENSSDIKCEPKKPITFEEIYSYKNRLYSYIYNLVKNSYDAEEVLQDTFIRAFNSLDKFRGESPLSTWLYTIARNLSYNKYHFYRRRKINDHISLDANISKDGDAESSLSQIIPDENSNVIDEIELIEYQKQIKINLKKLPLIHQTILDLKINANLSYGEIAERLNINEGTVKSRISRARDALLTLIQTK